MEIPSSVVLDCVTFMDRTSAAAFNLAVREMSGGPATAFDENQEDEELEGCGVQVEVATPDEELPPSEGGVA